MEQRWDKEKRDLRMDTSKKAGPSDSGFRPPMQNTDLIWQTGGWRPLASVGNVKYLHLMPLKGQKMCSVRKLKPVLIQSHC